MNLAKDMQIVAGSSSAPVARRIRRTRKYGGWRARIASWLRAMADIVNPLEAP